MSERPPSVFGGTRIYTFASHVSLAAPQTLKKGGDDVCGHAEALQPALGMPRVATGVATAIHERRTEFPGSGFAAISDITPPRNRVSIENPK